MRKRSMSQIKSPAEPGLKAQRLDPDPPQGELVGAPAEPSPVQRAKGCEKNE